MTTALPRDQFLLTLVPAGFAAGAGWHVEAQNRAQAHETKALSHLISLYR